MANALGMHGERIWLGFKSGKLSSVEHGKSQRTTSRNGLDLGGIAGIYPGKTGLWLSGDKGVLLKLGQQFHPLLGIGDEHFENAGDVLELPNGDLWIAAAKGVYRVPASEVRLAVSNPDHPVRFTIFDESDGVEQALGLGVGGRGQLWLQMQQGRASIRVKRILAIRSSRRDRFSHWQLSLGKASSATTTDAGKSRPPTPAERPC